ncbi:hypothetical protein LF1_01860 [Rubripirellula obstinata]|uniref:Uncharacterized protein n=1 Tax=Rubripirellula obstinata TaxID=406547 RepID=A0A5B1C974_9BACT|nr:hypothetical protein LF1_01860 [Rubripirellula obstinata]
MLLPNCKVAWRPPAVCPLHQPRRRAAMLLPNCKSSMAAPRRASATSTTAEGRHATPELQK